MRRRLRSAQDPLYRFIRWSRLGVLDRNFAALAGEGPKPEHIMIDAAYPKLIARRQASSKGAIPSHIGRKMGVLNSKPHTVCDGEGP